MTQSDVLVLVRVKHQSRSYWLAADHQQTIQYSPHVTQDKAVTRFEAETGRTHSRLIVFRDQHAPAKAKRVIAEALGLKP